MQKTYKCQIYYAGKAFIIEFPIFMAFTILLMLFLIYLNISPSIGVVIVITFWISPFVFQKKIRNKFTKNALLEFDDNSFSITTSNLNDNEKASTLSYNWDEIKAYKFYFTDSKLTYLDIYLKNGKFKEFGFKDNKTEEESINNESVFSIFYSFIKKYNADKPHNEKIYFAPGFLVKPVGIFLLFILAALIAIDITLHILKYESNIGFIIFATALFLGLIGKRIEQKRLYERMRKLD